MAIALPATGGVSRAAAYLNPAASWTRCGWLRRGATNASGGKFRAYWSYGDTAFAGDAYIFLGSNVDTDDVVVEVFDGVTSVLTTAAVLPAETWRFFALTYDLLTTTLTFSLDHTVVGTLVIDLAAITFSTTNEAIGSADPLDFGDLAMSYPREWQVVRLAAGLLLESQATSAVDDTDLLTDTRLVVPTELADLSGNGRNWSAFGPAKTYVTGPTGLTFTPGNLFVTSDLFDSTQGDAVELVRASGLIAQGRAEAFFEFGDVLPSGVFGGGRETAVGDVLDGFAIYSATFQPIALVTSVIADHALHWGSPTYAWGTATFYFLAIAKAPGRAVLYKISASGVVDPTTWTLPADGDATVPIAINRAGTILYYATRTVGVAIHAYDLVNSVALPDFVAGSGTVRWGMQFYVTAADEILVPTRPSGAAPSVWVLRRYNAAGVLQGSFALATNPNTNYFPELASDPDPTLIWVRTFSAGSSSAATSILTCYTILTGAVVVGPYTINNLDGTGYVPTSCPWWVLRTGTVPPPTPGARTRIRRLRTFPLPFDRSFWVYVRRIEFLIQSGVGLNTGQGQFPKLEVRFSGDGGLTWGHIIELSMGLTGAFDFRPVINNIGKVRNGWVEVTDSDPVRSNLLACFVDAEENTT